MRGARFSLSFSASHGISISVTEPEHCPMSLPRLFKIVVSSLAILASHSVFAAAGDPDLSWNPSVSGGLGRVHATAVQADGKIIIAGDFTTVLGVARNNIARINTNRTLDTTFRPDPNGSVWALAVQNDGDIVFGGDFSSVRNDSVGTTFSTRSRLARYNADGTLDTTFATGVTSSASVVYTLALDQSGRLLVGGIFTTIGGSPRPNIARLNQVNGTLDTFNPGPSGSVRAMAIQDDGKIVIGGGFDGVGSTARNRIARVNADGSLDTTFNPNANAGVLALAVQRDGKVLLGGDFTSVGSTTRNRIARVNADGSLDTTFTASANGFVNAITPQADGKILYGGNFTTVTSLTGFLARLNADGSADTAFDPAANAEVYTITLDNDGGILVGGRFTFWTGATTSGVNLSGSARLANDAGSQSLTINQGIITWNRSGSLPELQDIKLEYEFVNPGNWQPFSGTTTRVGTSANWQVTSATSLPTASTIRATGRTGNGTSSSTVRYFQAYSGLSTSDVRVTGNGLTISSNDTTPATSDHTDFGSVLMATNDSISRTFTIQNTGTAPLALGTLSAQIYKVNSSTPSGFGYDGAFVVTTPPVSPVAPGGTTTFTITFNPSGLRQIAQLDYQVYFDNNSPAGGFGFVIRGTGLNTVPTVANPIPDQSINLGSAFNYTIPFATFSDADRNFDSFGFPSPSYTAAPLPAGVNLNSGSGAFSGTPTAGGSTDITVTYTDSQNATVSDTFRLTVVAPNVAPTVASPIPDQPATQGAAFLYTFPTSTFADANAGDTLTYTTLTLPGWLTFNAATRTFSGTPGPFNVGTPNITVTATDNGSPALSVSDTFIITVANVNDAPTLAIPFSEPPATQGTAFSFTFPTTTFSDMDAGNVFTYTTSPLPSWLSFNAATRTFSGTPGNANVGTANITLTATDNGTPALNASYTFSITVANVNDAPTVANPIPDRNATEDVAFSYTFPVNTFSDIDTGDSLTYSSSGVAFWLTFNPATRTFSGTPGNVHVGFVDITVTATDKSFSSVSDTFRITIANVNDAPFVANNIGTRNATEDVLFSYTVPSNTFSDVDVDTVLTYSVSTLPNWLAFNPATRTFSGTPAEADVGFVDITVTATDNGTPTTASASDSFRLIVTKVNDVPVFTKGADQTLPGGTNTAQTVVAWATGINDGDPLDVQSLTFLVSNDNPGLFSTAPAIASNGTLTYTPNGTVGMATIGVSLRDDTMAGGPALTSAEQTFTISLIDNTGPAGGSLSLAPSSIVDAGATLTVTFAAWTDSSSPLAYAVLVNNVVVSASGPLASRTITAPTTAGTYTLKGRILDSLGNPTETSQSFTVLTALESWRKLHFGSPANSGDGADTFDFEKDGIVNLVEFAFGMNPKVSDSSLFPRPQMSGGDLTLSYPVRVGVSGITHGAQWSETLAPVGWQTILNTGTAAQPLFSVPKAGRQRLFMRHVITAP